MSPVDFPESNVVYGPPPDLAKSQCMEVKAFQGQVQGGSCDGVKLTVVAWQLSIHDVQALGANGGLIYLSFLGGLPPHFVTTNFRDATHPA